MIESFEYARKNFLATAEKDPKKAVELMENLFKAFGDDMMKKVIAVNLAFTPLWRYAEEDTDKATCYLMKVRELCGEDHELKELFIVAGIASLKAVAEKNELVAAKLNNFVYQTALDSEKLQNKFIESGMVFLPGIAGGNAWAATILLKNMVRLFDKNVRNIEQRFDLAEIAYNVLPLIARTNGAAAQSLMEGISWLLEASVGVLGDFGGYTVTEEGNKVLVYISNPGGSENRFSFATNIKDKPDTITFTTGCFKGTAEELLKASSEKHGLQDSNYWHYKGFVSKALLFLGGAEEEIHPVGIEARHALMLRMGRQKVQHRP